MGVKAVRVPAVRTEGDDVQRYHAGPDETGRRTTKRERPGMQPAVARRQPAVVDQLQLVTPSTSCAARYTFIRIAGPR
ncbi:hypothetical protein [Burkholderia ambifaria]|jgi:hypothetical protein|uniref:hypothetical protein n=1 Tax=Burkholderia ambifaria TaxID=152480 RepID=UPI001BA427C6|nr:hypothetical protein [Burkholderia ambifaria]MBR8223003.1 hypothetical protein [Burkholderia ambifaria]